MDRSTNRYVGLSAAMACDTRSIRSEVSRYSEHPAWSADPTTSMVPRDVDAVDTCPRRAGSTPGDHTVHCRGWAFELGFDGAVGPVTDISVHAGDLRHVSAGIAKPDALYPSGHDDPDSDRGVHTWQASQ